MDCRETQDLLTAFHDAELSTTDSARVEEHLRGCRECGALLADLARADRAAGVPDPGPAYWDRFNARVMERVSREAEGQGWASAGTGRDATGPIVPADGPKVATLRPKRGWMRQQFRYLVPAAAAAALVVVVVRYGGMQPGVPAPAVPRSAIEPAATSRDGQVPMTMDGQVPRQAGMPRVSEPRPGQAGMPPVSEPRPIENNAERLAAAAREEESRHPPYAPAEIGDSSLPGMFPSAPGSVAAMGKSAAGMQAERKKAAATLMAERQAAGKGRPSAGAGRDAPWRIDDGQGWPSVGAGRDAPGFEAPTDHGRSSAGAGRDATGLVAPAEGVMASKEASATSPCERARELAVRERFREAEAAQRACLAGELPEPAREKGLVFLAELLDRQARFADADTVIREVDRRFPQSRPLDLYRQQRPMIQKLQK